MSNDDTLSLDEALNEASSTLTEQDEVNESVEPNPEVQKVSEDETEIKDDSASPDGEKENDDSKTETEIEESFLDKVPTYNELPEELKPIYRNWQKQYTAKRQIEREEIKRLQQQLEDTKTSQKPESNQNQIPKNTLEMTPEQLDKFLTQREEANYLKIQEDSFYKLDSRLQTESPDYDPYLYGGVIEQLVKERDDYDKKTGSFIGFDFVGRAKELINKYDQKLKLKGQEVIKQKTKKGEEFIDKSRRENIKAKSLPGKTKKVLDLDESVAQAFEEINS